MGMLHQPSDVHVDITHGSSPPTVVMPLDRLRVLLSLFWIYIINIQDLNFIKTPLFKKKTQQQARTSVLVLRPVLSTTSCR